MSFGCLCVTLAVLVALGEEKDRKTKRRNHLHHSQREKRGKGVMDRDLFFLLKIRSFKKNSFFLKNIASTFRPLWQIEASYINVRSFLHFWANEPAIFCCAISIYFSSILFCHLYETRESREKRFKKRAENLN